MVKKDLLNSRFVATRNIIRMILDLYIKLFAKTELSDNRCGKKKKETQESLQVNGDAK